MPKIDDYAPFDASLDRQPDRTRYPGSAVHVTWDRNRCMHAAECGRGSKAVFDAKRSPWIDPDQSADPDELIRIVHRCPSGALQAWRVDGTLIPAPAPAANEVTVCPDGPVYVRGRVVVDGSGEQPQVALCRCGASRNKPYCDASHSKLRFRDPGSVNGDPDGGPAAGGVVTATFADNGPAILKGPMTLRAASGRVAAHTDRLVLCRCGNSSNKPFCDGSHKTVGWRSIDGDGR